MLFDTGIWMIISCLCGLITGYCLYGGDPGCAFQCHCAVDSECSGGTCPSGCDTAPLGYNWRGPACQIGNVGLYKPANMTPGEFNLFYPPTAALDGVSPRFTNVHCANPRSSPHTPAEWWTDLGDVYKIYNITIYGSSSRLLKQFQLTVYNTSDNEVLCGCHHDHILRHSTITCTEPVIGRYVHFKKIGRYDISWTPICEVVIIGHKYIDCSDCPSDVTCNDVTGCAQCRGSYPPDCKTKCESGYYGTNCRQQCGHCKDGATCDNRNGTCYNGCQMWWADDRCDKYIEKPNGAEKRISVSQKTKSSIEIEWQQLTGISAVLNQYYGYLIQYKDDTTDASYREAATVNYTSSPYWKIENLKSYTRYFVQIKPFRVFDDQKDYGYPYPVLQVNTRVGSSTYISPYYVSAIVSVISLIIIITLAVMLGKSRRELLRLKSSSRTPGSAKSEPSTEASNGHLDLTSQIVEYELVTQDTSINQHKPDVGAGLKNRNDDAAQYEDIKGPDTTERVPNTYESLPDEAKAVYENKMMTGPYAELGKRAE